MFERLKNVKRIILSIGHGGKKGERFDSGATANGITENDQCTILTNKLQALLVAAKVPVLVIPDFGLTKTVKYMNNVGNAYSDWAFEIHKDSATYNPATMHRRMGIYAHPESTQAMRIAQSMVASFQRSGANATSWARVDSDSNHGSLWFIRKPKMLSMIIEAGFIEGDCSDAENNFLAQTICEAILHELSK